MWTARRLTHAELARTRAYSMRPSLVLNKVLQQRLPVATYFNCTSELLGRSREN
jgi:hypothetical protein